ncbi:small ribosomal subunit Rsm22 family protein [Salinispira pacifica]
MVTGFATQAEYMKNNTGSIDQWIPRLIGLWRGGSSAGPADRLTPRELRPLAAALRELSTGLTGSRRLAGSRYMNDPRLLGAYLLYFWPVSYAQLHYILADIGRPVGAALDVGCGPLPATCALLDRGASAVTSADINRAATTIGRKLLTRDEKVRFATWNATTTSPPPSGRYDTVVLSHVLNELWTDREERIELRLELLSRLGTAIRPSGRLIITEPALLGVTRDLLALRDRLVAGGWFIESPCFLQESCPALMLPKGTCHAAFRWKPPRAVAELASYAGIDKSRPAMSYLVARPPNGAPAPGGAETPYGAQQLPNDGRNPKESSTDSPPYRVVSDQMRNKAGRVRLFVCGADGRFPVSTGPEDDGSAAETFRRSGRGDVVCFDRLLPRRDGYALGPESEFRIIRQVSRRR